MTTQWMLAICYTKAVNEYMMDVCSLLCRLVFNGNKRNPPRGVKQLKCTAGNLPPSSVRYWEWSFTFSSPTRLHDPVLRTETTLSSSFNTHFFTSANNMHYINPDEEYEWKRYEKVRQNFKNKLCQKYLSHMLIPNSSKLTYKQAA